MVQIPTYHYVFGSNWTGGALSVPVMPNRQHPIVPANATMQLDLPASYCPHGMELVQLFGIAGDTTQAATIC